VNKTQDYIDELIAKYLAGEADTEEIVIVENWAKESSHNQFYLDHFRTIFQKANIVKELQVFDTDAAWNKLKRSLDKPKGKTVNFTSSRSTAWWTLRIAASVLLVLSIGFYIYKVNDLDRIAPVVVVAAKEAVADTLPDGSKIVLNKASRLSYAFDKKTKAHKVKLEGEAYFNIQHDKSKNFIIEINDVFIRDIGTSFNVKAYPGSNLVEVVVEKGEVMFYTANDSGIYLRENGKGVYNKTTKQFILDKPEANVLAYKTKLFSFNNTELGVVVESLNHVYSRQVVLPAKLQHCRLTVAFNNETQEEIIAVIAETFGLTVNESGDKIMLEGEGCEP
jgi:transmembrane sensor